MRFGSNDHFQTFCIIFASLLLLKPNQFTLGDGVNVNNHTTSTIQSTRAYYRNMSMNSIRFQAGDFEPRIIATAATQRIDAASSIYNDNNDDDTSDPDARKSRGLHFKADNNDLAVDLEFIVPFIRIPIASSVDVTKSAIRNLVDLNSGTLLLSGAFIAVGAAVAGVVKVLSTPTLAYGGNYGYGYKKKLRRSTETFGNVLDVFNLVSYGQQTNESTPRKSVTKVNEFISRMQSKLRENDVDMSACIQKTICSHVKKAVSGVRTGNGSAMEKIIDGFANLDVLQQFLNGTAVQHAVDTGNSQDYHSCDNVYHSCKWMQPEHQLVQTLLKYFRLLYNP